MGELKPGWRRYRFEQMAINVNDRVDDPKTAGVERYVGLEHLDSESLKIRRWGTPEDVEAQKLRFGPGDIIFGKRRAYQRKLAVADFEGICSAHAMVLRARPNVVLPEFLPFFMQSDLFMERAQQISVGSLSPTINWKTLATEEFALPPLEVQAKIVWLLSAARAQVEAVSDLFHSSKPLAISLVDQAVMAQTEPFASMQWRRAAVGDVATVTKLAGFEYTKHVRYNKSGEIIAIRPMNIKNGRLVLDDVQRISKATSDALPRSKVRMDDVLFTYIGMYIGEVLHVDEDDRFHLAPNIARISPSPAISGRLLAWLLRSSLVQNQIRSRTTGTYTLSFTMANVRQLRIAFPVAVDDQDQVADMLDSSWACHLAAEVRLARAREIQRELLTLALEGSVSP